MERFIGLDVHASSTTVAVVGPSGRKIRAQVVETNGAALIEAIKAVPGQRCLCLEECTQASWLFEVLSPHVERLVVVGLGQQRSRGPKDDARDAFALANRMRLNDFPAQVFKKAGPYTKLRQLSKTHRQIVTDVVRVQNRIRALLRSRGVATTDNVYREADRHRWVQSVPAAMRSGLVLLYAQYDAALVVKKEAERALRTELSHHAIAKVLMTCPGLGPIRVATLLSTVVAPQRFRTRQQFWSYCGLGIVMRSSSDWVQTADGGWHRAQVARTRGLTRRCNKPLKAVFKGAAVSILAQKDHVLKAAYRRRLDAGMKPNLAKLTLARTIAATVLAMWKKEEPYRLDETA